jgi:DNA-binding NarL/FixJ family response regulator
MDALTTEEAEIVELVEEGLTRWAIAEHLDLSEDTVRLIVRRLCSRYDVPMRDLPEAVRKAADGC